MNDSEKDGGYYAIKGFLYQFDKTIIDILDNPEKEILIEQDQDLEFDKYVIQVKHKETQKFSSSKIKKPLMQLINLFINDKTKKYLLYCYFNDKEKQELIFENIQELDQVLGSSKKSIDNFVKLEFIKSFRLIFSSDFNEQFNLVLDKIKKAFNLKNNKDSIIYHSYFRSHLLQLATKPKSERNVSKVILKTYIDDITNHVFYLGYSNYLGKEEYFKFLKTEYFSIGPNLNGFERLFIVDCDDKVNITEIIQIVQKIIRKYFSLGKSPAPFICLRGVENEKLNIIKQDLFDTGIVFSDGTNFDGDKFRPDKLLIKADKINQIQCKFLQEVHIDQFIKKRLFKQYFHFFLFHYYDMKTEYKQIKIEIEETKEILKIL